MGSCLILVNCTRLYRIALLKDERDKTAMAQQITFMFLILMKICVGKHESY
jgi:hypothetical protein